MESFPSLLTLPTKTTLRTFEHIVTISVVLYGSRKLISILRREGPKGLVRATTTAVIGVARRIPGVEAALDDVLDSALVDLKKEITSLSSTSTSDGVALSPLLEIPQKGKDPEEIKHVSTKLMQADAVSSGFDKGANFGGIYHAVSSVPLTLNNTPLTTNTNHHNTDHELQGLQSAIVTTFLNTNQLYPTLFRTTRRFEAEAVAMTVSLLQGRIGDGSSSNNKDEKRYTKDTSNGLHHPHHHQRNKEAPCGLFTSGGTESIFVAVKAYRDAALTRLGYKNDADNNDTGTSLPPVAIAAREGIILEVLAGITAHPALDKACALLGIQLRKLSVDPIKQTLTPESIKRALQPYTLFVYTSAPGFAHGTIDPIPDIADVASTYAGSEIWSTSTNNNSAGISTGIPVHVDNCLGGILLSYMYAAQQQQQAHNTTTTTTTTNPPSNIPCFDFRAHPNVTTISVDLHKYGCTPKGASVIAFRSPLLRRYSYSAVVDYPGGYYTTTTFGGSRGGAPAALAWSTMMYFGAEGYSKMAATTAHIYQYLRDGIQSIPELQLIGTSHACIIAFTTRQEREDKKQMKKTDTTITTTTVPMTYDESTQIKFSAYAIGARMEEKRGWHIPMIQNPGGLHLCITERLAAPYNWDTNSISENNSSNSGRTTMTAEVWLEDLRACVQEAKRDPFNPKYEGKGNAAIYGAASMLPSGEIRGILAKYCDYLTLVPTT